jgi:hypothetical protein
MIPRLSVQRTLGVLLLAQALAVDAQPAPDTGNATAADEQDTTEGQVSLQLLEFLGEFTTEDGEWVDPAILMEGNVAGSARAERERRRREGAQDNSERGDDCVEPRCE